MEKGKIIAWKPLASSDSKNLRKPQIQGTTDMEFLTSFYVTKEWGQGNYLIGAAVCNRRLSLK